MALLFLLAGGIFYAAVAHKPAPAEPVESLASRNDDGQEGGAPKTEAHETAAVTDGPISPPPATTSATESRDEHVDEAEKATAEAAEISPAEPLGLYSERTRADRENWIGEVGGTAESELGVADGLDWLARHQAEDGHWGPDCVGPDGSRCEKEHPCGGPGGRYEAALTGLAVLAFQAGGNYDFNGRKYTANVRRGLDWLVARQGANGEIVGLLNPHTPIPSNRVYYDQRYMYEHAIATFALAEACAVARAAQRHADEKYLAAVIKAVRFIEAQQHDDGGWRYRPIKPDRSDTSISGWAMLALKTAKEADLKVNPATVSKMTEFFKHMADPLTGRTRYEGSQHVTDATTGVGMMVDEFINHQTDSALIHLASDYLAGQAESRWGGDRPGDPDFYLWYNCTLAMFLAGGDPWNRWNNVVRNHVLTLQIHGSDCARGSWEPKGQWGSEGGRIFSTALAVLTLEVYYRFARNVPRQE
ncbi:MAG TPA: prenyltransferase/squalene oxidase repeat-containing protein [Pirellulales bacterium]|nr:prenyltransferase/squalene oxidase repeat-containing protein [Pirellulales bacterium]